MEQKTRGGRGFWYIWGSVLIKLGIAYLVYMAAVSLLAGVHLMQMTGGDADAMMQIAQSTAQSGKLYDQITNELMNWAIKDYVILHRFGQRLCIHHSYLHLPMAILSRDFMVLSWA